MCIGARSVSFYFSKGITIFLKTMYTLLQFSLPVFTISTKILFLPYLYVVVGQVPGPFDLWHYCMQAFAKKVWPCGCGGGIACNQHRGSEKPVTPTENTLPLCRTSRVAQPLKTSAQTGKSTWQPTWCKQCIQQS